MVIISSHFTLSKFKEFTKVCLSCTRISDKVPGKLGGASTGDTRLLQSLPDIMLPEADSAQASRRCLSEFSSRSRISQNSPDYMLRIRQYTDFSSPDFNLSCTIHAHLAIMSQPSTERNSTMPLPAFFVGRWLLAEQPEILMQWFAFVSLLQWKLN